MLNIKAVLKDILKSLLIGAIIAAILTAVISLIGLVFFGFDLVAIINALRAALFVFGALLLFIASYILLFKKEMLVNYKDDYKKTFKVLNFELVLLFMSFAMLLVGMGVDYISYLI